jgi:ATP-dependent Clp protease ATP-binding subunit ClpC
VNGYNFTTSVREVLQATREEAGRLGHGYVGTEHILLGILQRPDTLAAGILTSLGATLPSLRASVETLSQPRNSPMTPGPDLPYTSRAKKVLEEAMYEARELRHGYVGTEHLLLGLFRERDGVGGQALAAAGLTIADVRAKAGALVGVDAAPSEWQGSSYRDTLVTRQPRSAPGLAILISVVALAIAILALVLSLR